MHIAALVWPSRGEAAQQACRDASGLAPSVRGSMGWHGGRHPKAGRPDRERIDVNERHELDYWSKGVLLARMETQMALGGIHRRRIDGVGKPAGTVFRLLGRGRATAAVLPSRRACGRRPGSSYRHERARSMWHCRRPTGRNGTFHGLARTAALVTNRCRCSSGPPGRGQRSFRRQTSRPEVTNG